MIVSILFLSSVVFCNTQAPPGTIFTTRSATWNTDGPKWNHIASLLTNQALDVLAVQEAGSKSTIASQTSLPPNQIHVSLGGFDVQDPSLSESIWTVNGRRFYIYYYDMRLTSSAVRGTTKQNMALISRERASEVIIIPNEVRHVPTNAGNENFQDRTFINRPALGIVVRNSIYFNLHAEPIGNRNEAPALLDSIEQYLQSYHPHHSWMVMGDFNRTPAELLRDLGNFQRNVAQGSRFFNIIKTGRITHRSRTAGHTSAELDYAVIGGPGNYASFANNMRATIVTLAPNPSDHEPVKFN